MFGLFQKKKEEQDNAEPAESTTYHEDLTIGETGMAFNYAIQLLTKKRDRFLSLVEKESNQRTFKNIAIQTVGVVYYFGFLYWATKDIVFTMCCSLIYVLLTLSAQLLVQPRMKKWLTNNSYIAFDKEINDTVAQQGLNIFGFDIEDEAVSAGQDLSNIQVFRNVENQEVIGLVVLKPFECSLDSDDKCVVEMGILDCSAVEEISSVVKAEMLDWCIARCETLKESVHGPVYLQAHLLGIDTTMLTLSKKKFKRVRSYKTSDKSFANKLPGFKKHVMELEV